MPRKYDAHRDELEGVAQRLRDERPEASPLELDRIKTTAMSRAKAGSGRGRAGARRLAVASLTVGLLAAGTGSVLAGNSGGGSKGSAASAQYGGNCDTGNGNGNSIGSGNGNENGNGNGNTQFAAFISHEKSKGKDKGGGSGGGTGNGSGNGNANGNGNGTENGNENGNESGNGNNNFNCNENSFNTTENNITENNTTTNNVTNTYNSSTVTIAAPTNTGVLGATTSKAKTSSKRVKFHINVPRRSKLRRVTLKVNGKVVSVLRGKAAKANVSIANLPCSATVTITAVTASGKTVTQTHVYKLC
jgi:hypothetical protein